MKFFSRLIGWLRREYVVFWLLVVFVVMRVWVLNLGLVKN